MVFMHFIHVRKHCWKFNGNPGAREIWGSTNEMALFFIPVGSALNIDIYPGVTFEFETIELAEPMKYYILDQLWQSNRHAISCSPHPPWFAITKCILWMFVMECQSQCRWVHFLCFSLSRCHAGDAFLPLILCPLSIDTFHIFPLIIFIFINRIFTISHNELLL